ncbi:MAG TPA: cobalamin-independent methionine synthase II family protein [Burkholderiales bacterium]|nr:cobalamin-independent methionine synthase II family protein [Burkholderiales bacterium]
MTRSIDRILTTHAGALPRSDELRQMVFSKFEGKPYDAGVLAAKLKAEVAEVVRRQAACGIDSINDGELGKTNFTNYVRERLSGYEMRDHRPGVDPAPLDITARDQKDFPRYFASGRGALTGAALRRRAAVCVAPLNYVGQEALRDELRDFRAALQGVKVAEAFLPANTPGTIEHWLRNEHYKTDEEFVYAIAEAMREEYQAIVDAGFLLQIDDPDLADGWQMYPDMSVREYRKYATLRVDALNHALRGIPREKVRLHACWGSFHGPHRHDIPLKDIVDIIFRVRASSYSIEASNPVHEHEWRVFEDVKPPEGAVLIPGVVGHCCDFIEHPELVAQRLLRYAKLIGRENVMGGTDCGLGPRVGSPEIAWAKLESLAQGARLASKRLWMRPAKPSKKRAPGKKASGKRKKK